MASLKEKMDAYKVIRRFMESPEEFASGEAATHLREARMIAYEPFSGGRSEMVDFGQFSRTELLMQCQYGSRFLSGNIDGYPYLGQGIRIEGDVFSYHSIRIHVDDLPLFLERYKRFQVEHCSHW